MKILVVNCGSSSIKYKLYEFPFVRIVAKGVIEKIGERGSSFANHTQGIKAMFSYLLAEKAVKCLEEISAIGHRVVYGGESFYEPQIIDRRVMKKIKYFSKFAPLHNPKNYAGIAGCKEFLPSVSQVAVFDTAFHHTLPDYAYRYALASYYYKKYRVRKYGFHGTSHQYVVLQASRLLRKPLSKLKLITCHLGNGCSITAIKRGKSIDTSMGFTPLEGLVMGTRSGDIDVAAVFYIMEKERLSPQEMIDILNNKSGLLGVSGISNDLRVIKREIKKGSRCASLALDIFIYRVKKYIGAYWLILGGADAIIFTAGIGENNPDILKKLRKDIYKVVPKKTKILVIPTDEEMMIAHLTYNALKNRGKVASLLPRSRGAVH